MVLLYLRVIVWQSLAGGFALSAIVALTAALALDFYFLPPVLSLRIADPLDVFAFVIFMTTALMMTRLVSRLRGEAERAGRRSKNLEQLYQLARQMLRTQQTSLTLPHSSKPCASCLRLRPCACTPRVGGSRTPTGRSDAG